MASTEKLTTGFWLSYYLVALGLITRCLWRVLTPGGSFPLPPAHYLSMGFDLVLLVVLILGRRHIGRWGESEAPAVSRARWVFAAALIAGIGLIAIRFTSHTAWWTGHLTWQLPG